MATQPIHILRICRKCGKSKPATNEYFVKKLDKLTARCKLCLREVKRAAWAAKSDEINAARRAARNDDTRLRERERYASAPERKRKNVADWRRENPEKRREIDRRHYEKFADKKRRQAAEWSARNPVRKRNNAREWYRQKRANDPMYRLRSSVSAYLYWCLKRGKAGRRTEALLGYSIQDLKLHLERQFISGMSWENYGEWHVDHIVPVASFSFQTADDPDFRACWALTNLRPMWAKDNIAKADKRTLLL